MPADIATLLAEAPWLARLARSLSGDAAEADDIVQETYAAALRSPPETDRPIRPWLRRVAVNLVRMRHRGSARRAANEEVVEAQLDPVRTPDELLERAQLERRLAELVIALDEPFRTTVLLRYREGLSAEQIAKQQGIPAGTVRSRLKTGLDRLRRELDDGEHEQLRAVFAPLVAAAHPRPAASAAWRIVMAKLTSKIGTALVVLVLLLGGGAIVVWQRTTGAPEQRDPSVATTGTQHAQRAKLATMFVQPGVAARRVRGTVTSDGVPYRGASVRLIHAQTELVIGEATSAVDGTFDLGDRAADVYVVTASAPDRAALPVTVDLRMPATPTVELRLSGCSHLRGTVVDGSGAPIAHARVAGEGVPTLFAETDTNGRYDLCMHFGGVTIRYAASGYQSVLVSVNLGASATRDVVLIPEAVVEGTVVTESGAPVPNAWVVVDPGQLGEIRNARAVGVSASDGTFRIVGVSPGRNLIAAFAPGLRSSHKQQIIAGAGDVSTGIIVRLTRTATITGVVVAGGTPVGGAGVGIRIGNRDETGVLAVTQGDGSFTIDRAPRGDVALYVENHTVITPRSVNVDASRRVRVEVSRMGRVRGRVLRGSAPVADAQVTCSPFAKVFTDASGTYVCEGTNDGPQELFADLPTGEWGTATVTVTRGETASLDIPLAYAGAICGRVVDEHAVPISGIEVRVAERTSGDFGKDISAADGSFCARQLTGGTYEAAVYAGPRGLEPLAPIGAITLGPRETKTIAIAVTSPRLAITGTVSDPHGAPVVDAIVRIFDSRVGVAPVDQWRPSSLALTDEAGRFALSKLAAGEYMLMATGRDGSQVTTPAVTAGSHDVAITLAAAGRIEGQLVGFTTPPTITAQLQSGAYAFLDVEVEGQRFRAGGLSPGTYVLMAVTDAREADTEQLVVKPGETTRATLTNRGTTTVTGVTRDFRTRAPVTGLRCAAMARQGDVIGAVYMGPDEAAPVDAGGAFRLISPAGEISLICMGGNRSGNRLAIVKPDGTTMIDVLTVETTQVPGTIDAELDNFTRRISELVTGGVAQRAGLAIGDEVIAVDGASVVELVARETMLLITQRPAGTKAQLTIKRGGEQRTIAVPVRAPN